MTEQTDDKDTRIAKLKDQIDWLEDVARSHYNAYWQVQHSAMHYQLQSEAWRDCVLWLIREKSSADGWQQTTIELPPGEFIEGGTIVLRYRHDTFENKRKQS